MTDALHKALSFGGVAGLVVLTAGGVTFTVVWVYLILSDRYRLALYWQIVGFPFTFYQGRAFGVVAHSLDFEDSQFVQRLGATTLLLVAHVGMLLVRRRLLRPSSRVGRLQELLLLGYCVSLTASQLFTHSAGDALLLSLGAGWQFLALFYLMISLIRRRDDVLGLLNAIFVMALLNILLRVVAQGQSLVVAPSSALAGNVENLGTFGADVGRLGAGALGPAVSYAGYIAVLITLGLAAYWYTRRRLYLLFVAIEFVELLNTYTRGGLLVLPLLGGLVFFKDLRRDALKMGAVAVLVLLLALPWVMEYLSVRGIQWDLTKVENFADRLDLVVIYFSQYSFKPWGNGILLDTRLTLTPWWTTVVHNTYVAILDACGPLPFLLFATASVLAPALSLRLYARWRAGRGRPRVAGLMPFVFIALVQWITFANTTSTSVLAYYPYEGTALFWIVSFLPFALNEVRLAELRAGSQARRLLLRTQLSRA